MYTNRLEMDETGAEGETNKIMEGTEPEKKNDDGNYWYIVLFYCLGTACFVPQNFYVTANEYWMYKFRDPDQGFNVSDTSEKTTLQKNFTAYAGIAGNSGTIVFLFVTLLLHNKIPLQVRILGSLTSLVVFFTLTLIFVFVDTDSWQNGFFIIALGIGALLSSGFSVLMVSLFQLAYKFPPRCLAAQLAGQSTCGILAAAIQVIALAASPTVKGTAALYYAIATATMVSVLIVYIIVSNKSEAFYSKLRAAPKEDEVKRNLPKIGFATVKKVLKKLALLIIALVLCVGNTGSLHAGLTALIESSGKGTNVWSDTYFLPVCVFLSYNTFEFIGREVSNHFGKLRNIYVIFATSVVRLALFPLILLCNIQPRNHLPVIFHDDAYFIIFMIILALSSGYLLNIAIIVVPEYCDKEEKAIGMLLIVLVMIVFVPIFAVLSGVLVNVI